MTAAGIYSVLLGVGVEPQARAPMAVAAGWGECVWPGYVTVVGPHQPTGSPAE